MENLFQKTAHVLDEKNALTDLGQLATALTSTGVRDSMITTRAKRSNTSALRACMHGLEDSIHRCLDAANNSYRLRDAAITGVCQQHMHGNVVSLKNGLRAQNQCTMLRSINTRQPIRLHIDRAVDERSDSNFLDAVDRLLLSTLQFSNVNSLHGIVVLRERYNPTADFTTISHASGSGGPRVVTCGVHEAATIMNEPLTLFTNEKRPILVQISSDEEALDIPAAFTLADDELGGVILGCDTPSRYQFYEGLSDLIFNELDGHTERMEQQDDSHGQSVLVLSDNPELATCYGLALSMMSHMRVDFRTNVRDEAMRAVLREWDDGGVPFVTDDD